MNKYVAEVNGLLDAFQKVFFDHVGRDLNSHADALAGLRAVYTQYDGSRTINLREIPSPSFQAASLEMMNIRLEPSWMDPLVSYLKHGTLPADCKDGHKIRCQSTSYFLDPLEVLYRQSYMRLDLWAMRFARSFFPPGKRFRSPPF